MQTVLLHSRQERGTDPLAHGMELSSQVRKSKPAVLKILKKKSSRGVTLSSRDVSEVRLKEIAMQEKH